MACERAHDRALLLSLGLFGAPAGQVERGREARAVEERPQTRPDEASRSR
jgi:hypothetical protein